MKKLYKIEKIKNEYVLIEEQYRKKKSSFNVIETQLFFHKIKQVVIEYMNRCDIYLSSEKEKDFVFYRIMIP